MEPWNLRENDTREEDSLPTFILFCEDEVSEPIYFRYFETDKIKLNIAEAQKERIRNVLKAISHCKQYQLFKKQEGTDKDYVSNDKQVWCVFDHDSGVRPEIGIEFDLAIEAAEVRGINVAWSNDAFELWVLLHFEDVNIEEACCNREYYYDRLTDIFKNIQTTNEDLLKARRHDTFCYKQDLKKKNNFRSIVRGLMIPNTALAIERIQKLEALHAQTPKSPSLTAPYTKVHNLLLEIINAGGRAIE